MVSCHTRDQKKWLTRVYVDTNFGRDWFLFISYCTISNAWDVYLSLHVERPGKHIAPSCATLKINQKWSPMTSLKSTNVISEKTPRLTARYETDFWSAWNLVMKWKWSLITVGRILGISYNDETAACDNNRSPLNEGDFVYIWFIDNCTMCWSFRFRFFWNWYTLYEDPLIISMATRFCMDNL